MLLTQGLVSVLSVLGFVRVQKVFGAGYIAYLLLLGFVEFFGYRWLILAAKISGTIGYFRHNRGYAVYERAKRARICS